MAKNDLYINKVNSTLKTIDFGKLEDETEKEILKTKLVEAFVDTYGNDFITDEDCMEDEGFASIPSMIIDSNGKEYVGLIDVNVVDGGEHYGTSIFCIGGVQTQGDDRAFHQFVKVPYDYKPLVKIVGDIHG